VRDEGLLSALLEKLTALVVQYVTAQVEAGADAVQLFDTWGGLLTREEYATFCVPALQRLAKGLQAKGRKVLLFVRGGHHLLPLFAETGCDGFSLDWRTPFTEARAALPKALLQGNLDPVLLFSTPEVVRAQTQTLLSQMKAVDGGKRCIVNLGHGILPGTPEANVAALVDAVVAS
jgi:uroporphyrinogen decarboxylase